MTESAGTYQEWRVHGQPGGGYPPYHYVWSRRITPSRTDDELETAARAFITGLGGIGEPWMDGPHLSKRIVAVSDWERP